MLLHKHNRCIYYINKQGQKELFLSQPYFPEYDSLFPELDDPVWSTESCPSESQDSTPQHNRSYEKQERNCHRPKTKET